MLHHEQKIPNSAMMIQQQNNVGVIPHKQQTDMNQSQVTNGSSNKQMLFVKKNKNQMSNIYGGSNKSSS